MCVQSWTCEATSKHLYRTTPYTTPTRTSGACTQLSRQTAYYPCASVRERGRCRWGKAECGGWRGKGPLHDTVCEHGVPFPLVTSCAYAHRFVHYSGTKGRQGCRREECRREEWNCMPEQESVECAPWRMERDKRAGKGRRRGFLSESAMPSCSARKRSARVDETLE